MVAVWTALLERSLPTQSKFLQDNVDWLREKLTVGHNFDTASGTGDHYMSIANPMHVQVADGVVWSLGWWQAANTTWWLLVKEADVTSFTRAQANFYLPTGSLGDVPTS
jgi:hypothetical protein